MTFGQHSKTVIFTTALNVDDFVTAYKISLALIFNASLRPVVLNGIHTIYISAGWRRPSIVCSLVIRIDCWSILHACVYRTVHDIKHLTSPNRISSDLISSELSGCEATQFAVAATNQNDVGRAADHVKAWSTANALTVLVTHGEDRSPSNKPLLIGRIHS